MPISEQLALEDQFANGAGLNEYIDSVRRNKGWALLVGILLLSIALGVAFGLPSIYESSGTILIEQQEIPREMVQTTVTTFADQRIQIISQRVMTSQNLLEFIKKYDLYKDERRSEPIEVILEQMRQEDITREPLKVEVMDPRSGRPSVATIAFSVSYKNKDPKLAQKVANELVSLYLKENLRSRTEMTEQTSIFLQDEADKLQEKITRLEDELVVFKEKNVNRLPELTQLNLSMMDKTEAQILNVKNQMGTFDERIIYLESELAQIDPYSGDESGRILSPRDRLKSLETEHIRLMAIYSPDHPDVLRVQKEIDALTLEVGDAVDVEELRDRLEASRTELVAMRERYSEEHPDIKKLVRSIDTLEEKIDNAKSAGDSEAKDERKPDNPVYIQLKAQLEVAQNEKAAMQKRRDELEEKLLEYEARLTAAPQVEREYREITRDYDNASRKYQEVQAKLSQARMAESLEAERKGERFSLIEPPILPEKPISPNRPAIAFLGVVLAIGGAIGTIAILEAVDSRVRGAKGVARVIGNVPFVTIPFIPTAADRKRKIRKRIILLVVLVVMVIIGLVLFHFFKMPLDIAWLKLLGKFGIKY